MTDFTHLSLFSGIGGLDLAAEWAGFRTVGQCEWADYPQAILQKHWPDVPKWRDIRTLNKESFYERTGMGAVDVVSGGFPCQPFSVAGKQKGKEDDRYLWPEMLRVIRELTPRWVVGENVPGILRLAAADVVADLEREGYHVVVFDFEAAAVGALHRRERVAFVGYAEHNGSPSCEISGSAIASGNRVQEGQDDARESAGAGGRGNDETVAYAINSERGGIDRREPESGFEKCGVALSDANDRSGTMRRNGELSTITSAERNRSHHGGRTSEYVAREWWAVEPDVGRVAHGVPNRVDRLKCLGNAVVPQQFYPIFRAIMEVEQNA